MTYNVSTCYTFRVSWEIKFLNLPNIQLKSGSIQQREDLYVTNINTKVTCFRRSSVVFLCKLMLSEIPKKPSRHDGLNKQMYLQCVKVIKSSQWQSGSKLVEVHKVQNRMNLILNLILTLTLTINLTLNLALTMNLIVILTLTLNLILPLTLKLRSPLLCFSLNKHEQPLVAMLWRAFSLGLFLSPIMSATLPSEVFCSMWGAPSLSIHPFHAPHVTLEHSGNEARSPATE